MMEDVVELASTTLREEGRPLLFIHGFSHNRHVWAGVTCQRCHGPVEEMDKLYSTPDTVWWPWLLPSKKLEMGWCVQCHRTETASQDCYSCHY